MLQAEEFGGDPTTCTTCRTQPVAKAPSQRAGATAKSRSGPAPVTRIRPIDLPPTPHAPRLGVAGSGDLEVRERRARRAAHQALAELHPEEFEQLLAAARAGEGLRA